MLFTKFTCICFEILIMCCCLGILFSMFILIFENIYLCSSFFCVCAVFNLVKINRTPCSFWISQNVPAECIWKYMCENIWTSVQLPFEVLSIIFSFVPKSIASQVFWYETIARNLNPSFLFLVFCIRATERNWLATERVIPI